MATQNPNLLMLRKEYYDIMTVVVVISYNFATWEKSSKIYAKKTNKSVSLLDGME